MEVAIGGAVFLFVFGWITWAYVTRDGKCPMKPEEIAADLVLFTVSRMNGYHHE